MSFYLIYCGTPMLTILGTSAWLFMAINVMKAPLSVSLDLLSVQSLSLCAVLVPALLVGAVIGRTLVGRMNQSQFEAWVLVLALVSAAGLLI